MTNEEAKEAFLNDLPVIAQSPTIGKIMYARITAIIYRKRGGKTFVECECLDRFKNSVTLVRPTNLSLLGGGG